jgi:hypothetical protein
MNHKLSKVKLSLAVVVLLMAIAGFTSCEKYTFTPPEVDPNYAWSLQTDIQPIFSANCIACHGGALSPDLRSGKSWNSLSKGGYVNLPAETSRLYVQISTNSSHIPKTSGVEKQKILYWITQGAKNN